MARRPKQSGTAERLDVRAEAGEWCWIGEIPQPPGASCEPPAILGHGRPGDRHWP